jgi:hypothetical protein
MTRDERALVDSVRRLRRQVTRDQSGRYWPRAGIDRALDDLFTVAGALVRGDVAEVEHDR